MHWRTDVTDRSSSCVKPNVANTQTCVRKRLLPSHVYVYKKDGENQHWHQFFPQPHHSCIYIIHNGKTQSNTLGNYYNLIFLDLKIPEYLRRHFLNFWNNFFLFQISFDNICNQIWQTVFFSNIGLVFQVCSSKW